MSRDIEGLFLLLGSYVPNHNIKRVVGLTVALEGKL
jgi:hypothetical protein